MTPGAGAAGAASSTEIEVAGKRLKVSNLDKVLWPATGFTKGQMIDYYVRVAPVLLAHLRRRPLTLKRYPNGVAAAHFYEKNCPSHRPDWVATIPMGRRASGDGGKPIDYCAADDLPTLVWIANLAAIELHPLLAVADDLGVPTAIAFDLDPGPPAGLVECCRVAVLVRDLLAEHGLRSFPKTSGSKGLQVYVPLHGERTYDDTKAFAHAVARLLESRHPDLVVERMDKQLRRGKVLIDWSQNHPTKTTVCVYSLRARERPTVSTPVTWDEVEPVVAAGDPTALTFEAPHVLDRVERHGDLFAPVLDLQQDLPDLPD